MKPSLLFLAVGIAKLGSAGLLISGPPIQLQGVNDVAFIAIEDTSGKTVKYKFAGLTGPDSTPNWILVTPATGTTPSGIAIGVNQSVYFAPGGTRRATVNFTTVDEDAPSTISVPVTLTTPAVPGPLVASVLHGATLKPVVVPGAMVSIFGSYLAVPTLTVTQYDEGGLYPRTLVDTSVTMNGYASALLYVSPNQLNVLVPTQLAGTKQATVVVKRLNQASQGLTVPVQDVAPGIFTADQSGRGQAVIRQMAADGTFSFNSIENPAQRGMGFELYATGIGAWPLPFLSDVNFPFQRYSPIGMVQVTVGGLSARLLYAGTTGGQGPWAVFQANATVPDGAGSGPQRLTLKISENDNATQETVIYVK
jgi:uncharacterized protein (TIGR03437 family)